MNKTILRGSSTVDAENRIINIIERMSGKYTPYTIFTDWVKMTAISIQNSCYIFHNSVWEKREQQYLDIARKYSQEEIKNFCDMCGLLSIAFEDNGISDYLGDIYMRSGAGNKSTGQFFTPFNLSLMTASLGLSNVSEELPIKLNEPSVGGGGMILAVAKVLHEKGINYQRCLDVVAQDLDWTAVYMAYIQLSLIGVRAIVVQGGTLTEPYVTGYPDERVLGTPALMGALV